MRLAASATWRTWASVVTLGALLTGCAAIEPMPGPFYQGKTAPGAQPGDVLRLEGMAGAPSGATAQRMLYVSTGLDGAPIAVSAVVIVPSGAAPQGRNIVAWAHPTTGVEALCAPSLRVEVFDRIPGLQAILAQGHIVVATDYPGLGTPGPHPYLVGVSEARAVLDSIRAVRRIPAAQANPRFAVWGHSQGGHAALFTGQLAKTYAPDLVLVGVAAAAPATDLGTLLRDDMGTTVGKMLTAYSLWSWSRVYATPLDGAVMPDAMPAVSNVAAICLESRAEILQATFDARPLASGFLQGKPFDNPPWRDVLAQNEPGKAAAGAPVFIAQGTIDQIVPPDVTAAFIGGLCRRGEKVRVLDMAGIGHLTSGFDSATAAVQWMTARFDGEPVPDDCAQRTGTR
jgi:pimeloyl-ACP methyl ester carboxylesterase